MRLLLSLFILMLTLTSFAKTGVVIIDMQDGFYNIEKTKNTKEVAQLISNQIVLIQWARKNGAPVVIFEYARKGKTDERLMAALKGSNFRVIEKKMDDGFAELSPDSRAKAHAFLQSQGVKGLIISGVNGGSCVMETMQGAVVLGYKVKSSPDLVADLYSNPPSYPDREWLGAHPLVKDYTNISEVLKAP